MKLSKAILVFLIGGIFSSIGTHYFWVIGKNTDKFNTDIGYGHSFPEPKR